VSQCCFVPSIDGTPNIIADTLVLANLISSPAKTYHQSQGDKFVSQNFEAGDFLIFQVESGYGLLRILGIEGSGAGTTWHLAAYSDLFLDVEMADAAVENSTLLTVSHPHIALTNRAFESTQVAKMKNVPLQAKELTGFEDWKEAGGEISDRSVRLMLGLR